MYAAGNSEAELCTTKKVSEYYGISYNHLVKVVHKLSSLGYLKAKQGRQGGFELSKSPKQINIGIVVRAIEPDFEVVECFSQGDSQCRIESFCKVKTLLSRATKSFLKELDKVTLEDVTKGTKKRWNS